MKVTSIPFWDGGVLIKAGTPASDLSPRILGSVTQAGWLTEAPKPTNEKLKTDPVVEPVADVVAEPVADSSEPDAVPVATPPATKPAAPKKKTPKAAVE